MSSWSQKVDNAVFDSSFVANDVASEKSLNSTKSSHFLVKVMLLLLR